MVTPRLYALHVCSQFEQIVQQALNMSVIWYVMTLMWNHCYMLSDNKTRHGTGLFMDHDGEETSVPFLWKVLWSLSRLPSTVKSFHLGTAISYPGLVSIYKDYPPRMMTSSNGNMFRVTGHLCGEFTGPRWIPRTKASDARFDVFFDLRLNKWLSKQSWGWWFETLFRPLWRHRNGIGISNFNHKTVVHRMCCTCFSDCITHLLTHKSLKYWPI